LQGMADLTDADDQNGKQGENKNLGEANAAAAAELASQEAK